MNDAYQPLGLPPNRQNLMLPLPPDRFSTAVNLHGQMHRYIAALRKRWWIIPISILLIGGPAVFYAVVKPPAFQSQALMWLAGRYQPKEGVYAEELTSYIGTQAALIKSPNIGFRALEKIRLGFPEIAAVATNSQRDSLPFALAVRNSQKNSVVELRATGPTREATRAFLDAVMEEYAAFKSDSRKLTSSGALSNITDQINEVERQIKKQQEELTAFGMSNNLSYLTEHGLSAGSHLAKLTEVLSDLRTEYLLLESLTPEQFKDFSKINPNAVSEIPLPGEKAARALIQTTGTPDAAYYQVLQQAQLLKGKRDEFAHVLRPSHSKMVKLNQEISGLDQLLKTLKDEGAQQALAQMINRKKSLELQMQNFEAQYHAWETNAVAANLKLANYDRMKQDLQRSQAFYDRLLVLLQTVDLNKDLDQEPLVAMGPASPAHATLAKYGIAAAGLFLALLVGVGSFVSLEFFDDRFTSANELSLHMPVAVISQIPESRLNLRNGKRRRLRHPEDLHAFTESFRNLCASLHFMFEEATRPKIILFTSAVPKEGKSTIAANFASTLAASGSRVLLIDADLRRSSLHQILGINLQPGLREVLAHALPAAATIVPIPSPWPLDAQPPTESPPLAASIKNIPNFFFLPAGASDIDSSELFLRSKMDGLLRDLVTKYNYVIIDSPPVLAANDVMSLASKADGVIMVVRASYSSSRMVREALDRLQRCNFKILGLVYNRASRFTDYYWRYSRDYYPVPQTKGASRLFPAQALRETGESAELG